MKKFLIFLILVLGLALTGCAKEENTNKGDDQSAGLANPASVYCKEHNGELEIREGASGQFGICKFLDGSECEEWSFYRGECGPNDESILDKNQEEAISNDDLKNKTEITEENNKKEITEENREEPKEVVEPTTSTGDRNIKIFDIAAGQTISSPVTIQGEGSAFENNVVVELRNNNHQALVQEPTTIKSVKAGETGPFAITLRFQFSGTDEGFVAVYEKSAKDGSELNLVEIPVKFATTTPKINY